MILGHIVKGLLAIYTLTYGNFLFCMKIVHVPEECVMTASSKGEAHSAASTDLGFFSAHSHKTTATGMTLDGCVYASVKYKSSLGSPLVWYVLYRHVIHGGGGGGGGGLL